MINEYVSKGTGSKSLVRLLAKNIFKKFAFDSWSLTISLLAFRIEEISPCLPFFEIRFVIFQKSPGDLYFSVRSVSFQFEAIPRLNISSVSLNSFQILVTLVDGLSNFNVHQWDGH